MLHSHLEKDYLDINSVFTDVGILKAPGMDTSGRFNLNAMAVNRSGMLVLTEVDKLDSNV